MSGKARTGLVIRVAGAAFLVWLAFGCAKAPPVGPEKAPVVVVPERRMTGISTLAFLPDPTNAIPQLPEDEEFRTPVPIETPTPIYPPRLLRTSCREGVVFLRLIIGMDGLVMDIRDSPLGETTPGDCGKAFRAAVEEAVRTWRFQPAEWRRLAPGEDIDGDGRPDYTLVKELRKVVVYIDIRIEFKLVNGRPKVTVEPATTA